MSEQRPAAVETRGLTKHYGEVVALDGVDVSIREGEYFVLLGPSGGGKTTLLRSIGGFHRPTAGQVLLHGEDVSHLPPEKRPTSMVFQSYALFPHMTVERNVSYGLVLAKLPKDEIAAKTEAMLELVGLAGYGHRKPHELSGGQQQRVQLARALVLDRDILLLDEPLAALDAQLRKDMCLELKHLQEKVGITFIHVTHNQEEAMTVADRIALIADGKLVEQGSAREVYEAPKRRFTASFVGENNLLEGRVTALGPYSVSVETAGGTVVLPRTDRAVIEGAKVAISVRSELVRMSTTPQERGLTGTYRESVYLGLTTSHRIALADGAEVSARVVSDATAGAAPAPGTAVYLSWPEGAARLHSD
jgi:ABC-type Fe3+/spermidine/putrescine transport system ATPase subunit